MITPVVENVDLVCMTKMFGKRLSVKFTNAEGKARYTTMGILADVHVATLVCDLRSLADKLESDIEE